jgi:hypothetical protein
LRLARTLLAIAGVVGTCLAMAGQAFAAVERFAVIIGNNSGRPTELPLRYAESDADRVHETLKGVGGFAAENILLLKGEKAPAVTRALIATNDRVRAAIGRPGTQVMLLVYFSGHADNTALHLADTDFELRTLEQLVRSSAAAFRVLVLDACRSGALTRAKGGAPGPPFLESLQRPLDSQGAVFLTSSSSTEDAQESDEIQGSFFTHYLTSALLGAGDSDGDGRVTLEEAYRYTYAWTLAASSRTRAGLQHPTFEYDVRGQGGIVITEPGIYTHSRATLLFPGGRDYLVTQAGPGGMVIGEVPAGASARSLILRPGRYFVRGRTRDHLLEGEVLAPVGQRTEVRDQDLRRVEYARLARKGGDFSRAHLVQAGYALHTPLQNADSLCQGAFAGYSLVSSRVDLGARLEGCTTGFANGDLSASGGEFAAGLRATMTHDFRWLSVSGGLSGGAALLQQRFQTRGVAPPRLSLAGLFGLNAALTFDLPHGLNLLLEMVARTYLFSVTDGRSASSLQPSLSFQQLVGLGKYW